MDSTGLGHADIQAGPDSVIVFYVVVIFPYIPVPARMPSGVSIFLGVLFSPGIHLRRGEHVAGIIITYMRPFRLGDRVRIGETEGDVMERTLLVTRIRTIKNVDVTVPNTSVLGSHIINFSLSSEGTDKGLILNTSVTIGYDVPWRKVHDLLIAAALATEHIVPDPKPFVLQTSLNDFHVSYELNAYTRTPSKKVLIYSSCTRVSRASSTGGRGDPVAGICEPAGRKPVHGQAGAGRG